MSKVYTLLIISIIINLVACVDKAEEVVDETSPKDLAGKQQLLKEKKEALKTLTQSIEQLESDIEQLSPNKAIQGVIVTVDTAHKQTFKHFVEIQSTIQSEDAVIASSEVAGRILKMPIKEGEYIKKGEIIATLDLEQIDKQIAEVETSLQLAQDIFERQERLWKQNIGSELQYLQAKNNKDRLEKTIESLQFQQTKSSVYAPLSGVVDKVFLKSGELAAPGLPIIQILDLTKIKVVADAPEAYITSVQRGDLVTIQLPILDKTVQGRVSLLGRTIHPTNRTFEIEVALPNPDGILKPNLLAVLLLNDYEKKDAIVISVDLVQQEISGQDYVFIIKKEKNKAYAKKVNITTGSSFNNNIVVVEGLNGGELVIAEGAKDLVDGAVVRIQ